MRVGLVSTYPPMRCAIGLYSQKLARALVAQTEDVSVVIVAEHLAEPADEERLSVRPCYRRRDDYIDAIASTLSEARCDVAHVQYAPDLFGEDERLPGLLAELRARGIRTVVTLHTVYGSRPFRRLVGKPSTRSFHRTLARHADRIVVHHFEQMATRLLAQGIGAEKISVIPHGTTLTDLPATAESRARLGLPQDAVVLTFFGFIHLQKNVHAVVEAFLRIARRAPQARLLVAGMPWGGRWYNRLYVGAIRARVLAARGGAQVILRTEYLPHELVPHMYAASDVILLPHKQRYGSASGVFHQAIGGQRPVLVARSPKFVDARKVLAGLPELTVPPASVRAWSKAMLRVIEEPALRERARAAVVDYARRTSWADVSREHYRVYLGLQGGTNP